MIDEDNSIEREYVPVRDVYYCTSFKNSMNDLVKAGNGLVKECTAKLSRFILNLKTKSNSDLHSYLIGMGKEDNSISHKIYRVRLTTGGHHGPGICRIYYCYVGEIPALRDNDNFESEGIVLLYFTYDPKGHDDYYSIFYDLRHDLDILSDNDITKTQDIIVLKNNLIYKYVRNSDGEFNPIPALTKNQMNFYKVCKEYPPCIIHGSAGSGKTTISEELYGFFSADDSKSSLYITYMEQLKIDVNDDLKNRRNIQNTDCRTFDDIVRSYLGENEFRRIYKDESYFKSWVNENKDGLRIDYNKDTGKSIKNLLRKINSDEDVATSIVYIFYRTFSTEHGYHSFNNNPNKGKMDDEKWFMDRCKKEKGLDEEKKRLVFFICKKYEKHLEQKHFINDNEAAWIIKEQNITGSNTKRYDNIIVDEVQDLTKPQIECIRTLLATDSKRIYLFGDDNQSINPTMMNLNDVRMYLSKCMGDDIDVQFVEKNQDKQLVLDTSFRSTKYIINYINYLNKIRKNSIGTSKARNEVVLKSAIGALENNESDYPAYIIAAENSDFIKDCLGQDKARFNDVMIITANSEAKKSLMEDFDSWKDNICTIEETKGREWNQVILYNFFSSAIPIWESITKVDGSDAEGKHSSIYRMYFNRFYVGLTRAKTKVIMIETGDISGKIMDTYFPSDDRGENVSLEHIDDVEKFNSYFKNDYTHDKWASKAAMCFKKEDYRGALDYQYKAIKAMGDESKLKSKEKEVLEQYRRMYNRYKAYVNVKYRAVESVSDGMVSEYASIFIIDSNMQFMKTLYDMKGENLKGFLVSTDPEHDYDSYLDKYRQVKNKRRMSKEEREFFDSNAIVAYRCKIFEQMSGE